MTISKPVSVSAVTELHFSPESKDDLMDIKRYITEEFDSPIAANNTLKKILMLDSKQILFGDLPNVH